MIALVKTGRTVKTSRLPLIGMKGLNILMPALVAVIQVMVAALRMIKVNSLNHSLVEANIAKVDAVDIVVRV